MKDPSLTLGVEEEYQVVDPETGELVPYVDRLLEGGGMPEEIKPELHSSVLEVGTRVCRSMDEVRSELVRLRGSVLDIVSGSGLAIVAAGTHPFSSWQKQAITPLERYLGIEEDLQELARKNLIFGMHVHVGIEDRDFMMDALKVSRYFIPHVLALTTSSPFWIGRDTGLKSYRSIQWRNFPRTGIPPTFDSMDQYDRIVRALVKSNSIPDASKIWWDVRPHHIFPTLEFRTCDVCTRIEEAVCVAAIFQALVAKLWKMRRDNMSFRVYPRALIEENKWRAARYGVEGNLLDLGQQRERPARILIRELVEWFIDDVVDDLGSRKEVEYAFKIIDEGTSADRQLRVFKETGEMKEVARHLVRETAEGVLR